MREDELRSAALCANCGKPFGHTGLPLFWRVTIERFGVDVRSVQRQDGLAEMLDGNSALARIMGPDEEMTKPLMESIKITLCENCAMQEICIAVLAETN